MQDNQNQMTTVIATREMDGTRPDGQPFSGFVDVGMPFQMPAPGPGIDPPWACMVRSRGLGDDTVYKIVGVDAIQALWMGLSTLAYLVSGSIVASYLDWKDVPNFGFPLGPVIPQNLGSNGCKPCEAKTS